MKNQTLNSDTVETELQASSSPYRTQTQEYLRTLKRLYHPSGDYSPSPRVSPVQQLSYMQNLESNFSRLGVNDSATRQHQPPLVDTRQSNQVYDQPMMSSRDNLSFPSNPQPLWYQKDNRDDIYDFPSYEHDVYGRSAGIMGGGNIPFSPRNVSVMGGSEIPFPPRNPYGQRRSWDYLNSGNEIPFPPRNPYDQRSSWDYLNGGNFSYNVVPCVRNNSSSKDHVDFHGLEEVVAEACGEGIDRVLDNLVSNVYELMVDPIGHHVFLKLLKKCSDDQITKVLDMAIQQPLKFVRVCADSYGYRAIEDLMRHLRTEEHISCFMLNLRSVALQLTKTPNAHDVFVFSFNHFTPQSKCLLEVIVQHCYEIAIDQYGCCMLQQCIGKTPGVIKERLIREIINNALNLCVNCYGNYVVQYVLESEDRQVVAAISRQLDGHYVHLSRDKYGSHAVQKCLKNREFSSRRIILTELLHDIDSLLVDQYGNYVVQTAWMVSQDDVRNELLYFINKNAQLMRCNRYGRKVLEKLNMWS